VATQAAGALEQVVRLTHSILIRTSPNGNVNLLQLLRLPKGGRNVALLQCGELVSNVWLLRVGQAGEDFIPLKKLSLIGESAALCDGDLCGLLIFSGVRLQLRVLQGGRCFPAVAANLKRLAKFRPGLFPRLVLAKLLATDKVNCVHGGNNSIDARRLRREGTIWADRRQRFVVALRGKGGFGVLNSRRNFTHLSGDLCIQTRRGSI